MGRSTPVTRHESGVAAIRVKQRRLRGGRQSGVEILEVDNGCLALELCPTRGMGVLCARVGALRIGWLSPIARPVHPRWIDLGRRHGTGWLDGFNEFVVRCGLRSIGPPGLDREFGSGPREFLTLHGRIANTLAEQISIRRTPGALAVTAELSETGPSSTLRLRTTISTTRDSRSFRVTDVVTNRGPGAAEFQVMYHSNVGEPLLGAGASFLAAFDSIAGADRHSASALRDHATYGEPTAGYQECIFLMWLRANARGKTLVALVNAAGSAAVSIEFSLRELPCMTLWKQTGMHDERYVTGLEPGTSFPLPRRVERNHGRVITLAPGERRRMSLLYSIHLGEAEIHRLRRRIARLQSGRQPDFLSLPAFAVRGRALRSQSSR